MTSLSRRGLLLGLLAAIGLGGSANSASLSGRALAAFSSCTAAGVCAQVSHRPEPVSASSATQPRRVGLDTTLSNSSGNRLTNVRFATPLPAGFSFLKDALGACSESGGLVSCVHPTLADGASVSNTLVFQTPVLPLGSEQTASFQGKWCWAGCDSDNPGSARVSSIAVPESVTVRAVPGFDASYLLAGQDATLASGQTVSDSDPLAGSWSVPGQAHDLAATVKETPNPPGFQDCPPGSGSCRSGDWFGALSPGTESFNPVSTVVYTQARELIPHGTTASNYQVVYTHCLPGDDPSEPAGCPVVRLPRCSSASELLCTAFVDKLRGGDFRVGVRLGSQNGYMR